MTTQVHSQSNAVSVRSQTASSANQARATSQSAAIALLGAGTTSADSAGSSFAQTLQSESKRGNETKGLFSDSKAQSRTGARADQTSPRRQAESESQPASPRSDESGAVASSEVPVTRPRTGADETEPGTNKTVGSEADATAELVAGRSDSSATIGATPADTISARTPAAVDNADAAGPDSTQPQTATSETKSRQPTDPLRLIVPGKESAEGASASSDPNQAAAAVSSQPIGAQVSASATQVKTSTARAGEHAAISKANASNSSPSTASTAFAGSSGRAATLPMDTSSAGSQSGAGLNGSAPAGVRQSGTADQIAPPRNGGGRPIEPPVTLKLRMQGNGTIASQFSDAEVKAAETQIARGLTAAFRQNTPQINIWMSPETLGKIRIHLDFSQGNISARFETTSEATRDLLAQNMTSLREALQSRGLTAQQIEVVSLPDWTQQNSSQSGGNQGRASGDPAQQPGSSGSPTGNNGQGNQPQQGASDQSRSWASGAPIEPKGNPAQNQRGEADVSIAFDPRLTTLRAHLELDALA